MLPLLGQGATLSHREDLGKKLFVKPLTTLSSSPIRNNSLKARQPQQTVEINLRIKSAESGPVSQSEENLNEESNVDPQSMAISRVMKSIRKQRLIQQQTKVKFSFSLDPLISSLIT
jgi:hypothetical protein